MADTTLFQKIWERHLVVPETADTPAVLYVDLHLTHEVTSPQAFALLKERGLRLRRPDLTLATMDHSTPTRTEQVFGGAPIVNVLASMVIHPPKVAPNPMLYVGFLLAAAGAGMVLYFRPPA